MEVDEIEDSVEELDGDVEEEVHVE